MLLSPARLPAESGLGGLQRPEPEAAGPSVACCSISLRGVGDKGWGAAADTPSAVTTGVLQAVAILGNLQGPLRACCRGTSPGEGGERCPPTALSRLLSCVI